MSVDYTPRLGDKVRVTVEGTVTHVDELLAVFSISDSRVSRLPYGPYVSGITVERVEPELQIGDVVRSASGSLYHLTERGWRDVERGWAVTGTLPRPLTLLIRNGEAVTS